MNIDELEALMKDKPKKIKLNKIMPLDGVLTLPMESRLKHKLKTKCFFCKTDITDEYFIGGFKKDYKNIMAHTNCYNGMENLYLKSILK